MMQNFAQQGFIPTRTSSAPPESNHDAGNFPSHNAWVNPPNMKDLSGNNTSQQFVKDAGPHNVINNAAINATGAMSVGIGASGNAVLPSPGVPVPVPISSAPMTPNASGTTAYIPGQHPSAIAAVHMNHQGGHDNGDRDNHSYNGPPGSEQVQVKQVPQGMIRQSMSPQSQPQMQPNLYPSNAPAGGGRPIQGQQQMVMMHQPVYAAQPFYPSQGNQIMYSPNRGCVINTTTYLIILLNHCSVC